MRKNIIKILLLLIIAFPKSTFALTFSLSKSADNLKPNNEVTITVSASEVESDAQLSAFNLALSFPSTLSYVSGGGSTDGVNLSNISNNKIEISYNGVARNSAFEIAKFNFRANDVSQATNSNVTLSLTAPTPTKNERITTDNIHTNNINITLLPLSSDATLKTLKIPNATLSPEFSKNVTEYSADVKDLTSIDINAVANDSSSRIQISDNYQNLQKGENLIKIVVTAENGNTKTYNIKVNLDTTPTDEELMKADATLKTLKIKDVKLKFKSEEKKYFIDVPYKTKKLNITYKATNEKAKVEMSSTKLKIGKNTITIKVTSEDGKNESTYELIVTRAEQRKEIVKTCPDETSSKEWLIYSISMFIVFSIGLVLGYLLKKFEVIEKIKTKIKSLKKEKVKEEPVEVESLSDTIEIDTKKIKEEIKKEEQ